MTISLLRRLAPKNNYKVVSFIFILLISFSSVLAQDIDKAAWENGKAVFKANCASCHHPVNKMTGPALEGSLERWDADGEFDGKSGKEWLYLWIKNNTAVLDAGHPHATELYNDYDGSVMNLFPALTEQEIDNILLYVDNSQAFAPVAATTGTEVSGNPQDNFPIKPFLFIIALVLLILVIILTRVNYVLKRMAAVKAGEPIPAATPIWKSKKIVTLLIIAVSVLAAYTIAGNAISLGRQQGYQPEQPINYSHELHAGKLQIECQYCHYGANKGKHANIPSVSICMNCHMNVQQGPEHGRTEIAKIYASIGYNPNEGAYLKKDAEGKIDLTEEEVTAIMTEYIAKDEDLKEKQVDEAVKAAVAMFNKPVEWVRIHNLPDHVYFNHAQHVNAGQVECQTCHGAIEEMAVVEQHAPLSMGWCINCHRETEVKFSSNSYYSVYEKFHEELENGTMDKVTVEDIGGTECQKCHY